MNEKELQHALKRLDDVPIPDQDRMLKHCYSVPAAHAQRQHVWRTRRTPARRSILAACVCLLVLTSALSIEAAALEMEEYRQAVAFFEENGLSVEGYSRSEIKKICEDITSERFTYHLTVDAIRDAMGVDNKENAEPLTPQQIATLWAQKQQTDAWVFSEGQSGYLTSGEVAAQGVSYVFKVQVRYADSMEDAYTVLEKYVDGRAEWSKTFSGLSAMQVRHNEDYIAMTGVSAKARTHRVLMLLNPQGELIWEREIEDASQILLEADRITVIGNGRSDRDSWNGGADRSRLYLAGFDLQGERLYTVSNSFYNLDFGYIRFLDQSYQMPSYTVEKAVRVGESYYLVLSCRIYAGQELAKSQMCVARVATDGHLQAIYEMSERDTAYRITDLAVHGKRLYIGGYAMPAATGPLNQALLPSVSEELATVKAALLAENGGVSREALLAMLREYYTGFVVCCDVGTGEIKQVQTLAGALQGSFVPDAVGDTGWCYRSIADAQYTVSQPVSGPWQSAASVEVDVLCQDVTVPIA